ncbi:beta strand repeat-containing protein [Hyalangium versicolor]|uniref:beta strand repeat-containing protein n=1 Tax=Hyalangium versicolor TaxID=2861190 RepID=UPI001CCD9BE6|nr:Ig-like domain-containing protein [Hyalangium versicolor]
MKKLSLVALLVTLSACKSDKIEGEAIGATVVLDPGVHASCVRFEVRDPSTHVALETRWLPRNKNELKIAVFPGTLPSQVELAARPYQDGDCANGAAAQTPNGAFVTVTASFVTDTVVQASPLALRPGRDTDNDQYVSSDDGGADCKDSSGSVNPGAQEQCTDQEDVDCDGKRGCEASTCGANACFRPPANLVLTVPTTPVPAGTCSSGSVQLKDDQGGNSRVTTATPVALAATPSNGISFYSNAACTAPAVSTTIPAQEGAATFYFQGQVVGSVTVSASLSGLPTASQSVQIAAGPGNRLVFLSQPQTVTAGDCSQKVQVQSQDAQGNAAPVTSNTLISLSAAPSAEFEFFTTSNCSGASVASISLAGGSHTAEFYFRGKKAGSVSVSVAAPGFNGSSQSETIQAGPPAVIALSGPTTVTAGTCSSTAVTATLQDNQGNAVVATSNLTVTLSATGKPLTFSTSNTCAPTTTSVTLTSGSSTVSFYFQGTQAGASIIQAAPMGLTAGTLNVTINTGPPAALVFTTPAQPVQAGNCSTVRTVQLRDVANNPIVVGSATAVALSVTPSDGVQFFTSSNCTGTPVTVVNIPSGSSDASFYFKGTRAQSVVLSATSVGFTQTQNETLNPGPPTVLVLSPSPLSMNAGECKTVNLQTQDTLGNASTVTGNQSIALTANPATGFTFHSSSGCSSPTASVTVNSGQANATFYVTTTKTGTVAVTASKSSFTDGTVTVQVSPATANKIVFTTPAQRIQKDLCSASTALEVQDTYNNPVSGARVINLTRTGNTLTFYLDPACTGAAVNSLTLGASQSSANFYFKDSAAESVTITASDGSLAEATQTETIDPVKPTVLAFTTSAPTLQADQCSGVVTVEAQSSQGSALPAVENIPLSLTASSSAGFTFYSNTNCSGSEPSVISMGQTSVSFSYKGTKAGTISVTASSEGLSSATQNATINPLAASKVAFSTSPYTTTADVCSQAVTINSVDAHDNVVPVSGNKEVNLTHNAGPTDPNFKFYSDAGCTLEISTATFQDSQNSASFYYKGRKAQAVTLKAGGGPSVFIEGSQIHNIIAAGASTLAFSSSTPPSAGLLAGTCTLRTVERRDAYGNPATDTTALTVNLSGSTETEFFTNSNCTGPVTSVSIAMGDSSADFYFKGYHGGDNATAPLTLTASSSLPPPATQTENIIPTVRSGICTIAGGTNSIPCPITPALANVNKAFLVFQATSTAIGSGDANVRCRVDTSAQVLCERNGTSTISVSIRWSVAEFPTGVTTQSSVTQTCSGGTTNVTLSSVVRAESFLLLSSERGGGDQSSDTPRLAELTTTTQAQIRKSGNCTADTNNLQAIAYAGAAVQRGLSTMSNGTVTTTAALSSAVDLSRSLLLYSYRLSAGGTRSCDRGVRGELTNTTTVSFSRGEGDSANCSASKVDEISWEVVTFPSGTVVQQYKQPLTGNSAPINLTTSVDPSRTLVIAGGQWASGQVHGEGKVQTDTISDVRAQAYLFDNSTVNLNRQTATSTATFTVFVVQLKP